MVKSRLIEQKMLILLRQGKISKWFSGIGQEAISVGVTLALKADEYILPMHRNLGVFYHTNGSVVPNVFSVAREGKWFYQGARSLLSLWNTRLQNNRNDLSPRPSVGGC